MVESPFIFSALKTIRVRGSDNKNLPPYASKMAKAIEKNKMIFLVL